MIVDYSAVNPHHLLTHIECAGELHVHVEVCNVAVVWRCVMLAVKPRDLLIHTVCAGKLHVPLKVCNAR